MLGFGSEGEAALCESPGGVQVFIQNVSAACLSAVNLVRRAGKIVSTTCASLTAIGKRAFKGVSAGCGTATTVIKRAARIVAVSCQSATGLFKRAGRIVSTALLASVLYGGWTVGKRLAVACNGGVSVIKRAFFTVRLVCVSTTALFKAAALVPIDTFVSTVTVLRRVVGKIIPISLGAYIALLIARWVERPEQGETWSARVKDDETWIERPKDADTWTERNSDSEAWTERPKSGEGWI